MELKIDIEKCLYCENKTIEDKRHFISECCGRGMCEDCYGNLQGTDEQIQLGYFDDEIIAKCGWKNADYLCYECYDNWAYYANK